MTSDQPSVPGTTALPQCAKDKASLTDDRALHMSQNSPKFEFSPWDTSEISAALSMIFGGCCMNVWTFEVLLRSSTRLGTILTFGQMLFITGQSLPQFVHCEKRKDSRVWWTGLRFRPRQVPLREWALQVAALLSASLFNNWAFAYDVPLTVQIIFRSSGLPISMLLGYLLYRKRYNVSQVASVMLVTAGAGLATISRTSSIASDRNDSSNKYVVGISLLLLSLLLTGVLGALQERTYKIYGPCWREGVFYTHLLSLPVSLLFLKDISEGLHIIHMSAETLHGIPKFYAVFAANLVTQLLCVSGVNRLATRVSSVSTNIALTMRKAVSLCLSVWLFNNGGNLELAVGAFMVFTGSIWYASASAKSYN